MELWNKTHVTVAPTAAPTSSPTSIRFTCAQTVGGVTYEDFFNDVDNTMPTFFDALANVGKLSSSKVFTMKTTMSSTLNAHLRRPELQSTSMINSTYVYEILIKLGVDTSWTEPDDAYSAVVMYINTAIMDGNLTALLQASGVSAFIAAEAKTYLEVGDYTVESTSNQEVSTSSNNSTNNISIEGVVGISLGSLFLVLFVFAILWKKFFQNKDIEFHSESASNKNPIH